MGQITQLQPGLTGYPDPLAALAPAEGVLIGTIHRCSGRFTDWQRWKHDMERYLSTGTSTLIALMAANRATTRRDRTTSPSCPWEDIAEVDAHLAYLFEDADAREASRTPGLQPPRPSPIGQQGCE